MKSASITETKNRLSAILDQVKNGETFLITEHGRAVAKIEPVRTTETRSAEEALFEHLERRGIIRRGRGKIRRELIDSAPPALPKGVSVLEALIEERRGGR